MIIPEQLVALPHLLIADSAHFTVHSTIFTRTYVGDVLFGLTPVSTILIEDAFTQGVVSISTTLLSLPIAYPYTSHSIISASDLNGMVSLGLQDSSSPVPKFSEDLGMDVKDSVSLDSLSGSIWRNTPSSPFKGPSTNCHSKMKEGDCLRMEVNLDSTPRTVQFFVNGKSGDCFVSGLPASVRIGFASPAEDTSFRIDRITRLSQPTPITPEMIELKW
ncbi:hypothetical protein BLNAU_6700 [Blattamonas nauphoetae]|uniref:SPRY domain-containing protein n=1 Tax=Blattamonas nauphoetae TaxID=2049346 RepID=A0ABQ9Y402_9EUKA|nr:hypothetical protein BLNAU_6700 [Blattamonas nauphoetae]